MKDTQFMSAQEKEKVLRQWELFLKSGLSKDKFTKSLYHHLIQHCSFIAHYDLHGFYATYFEEGEDTARFLSQFDTRKGIPRTIEYGDASWLCGGNDVCQQYYDINTAMCKVASKYIPDLLERARNGQREVDVSRAKALLAKHGLKASIRR